MWSADFAKWWLVNRMVDTTNQIFMRHFRGTLVLKLLLQPAGKLHFPYYFSTLDCRHTLSGSLGVVYDVLYNGVLGWQQEAAKQTVC